MSALGAGWIRMRRAVHEFCCRSTGRSGQAAGLAHDLGLPPDEVSEILDRTASDLLWLTRPDATGHVDLRPIVARAVHEICKLGFQSLSAEEAITARYLRALPDREARILLYFKQGKKHREIAELLGTDASSVSRTLLNIYADLRVALQGDGIAK